MAAKTDPRLAMTGTGWEATFEANNDKTPKGWLEALAIESDGRLKWWRNPQNASIYGGKKESGIPDFCVLIGGVLHFIECKHEDGTSLTVGRSTGEDDEAGNGVKPSQYRWMSARPESGGIYWIAARLNVPAAKERKQGRLLGPPARQAESIQRLIPWQDYRPWIDRREAAIAEEDQWPAKNARRLLAHLPALPRPEVQASIPAADLAVMGWPLRSAQELLAALAGSCER